MSIYLCTLMNIADSARAQHPVHGDVCEGEHQHRPRVLGAGRGHPRQDGGARGGRRPRAHRRRAPPLPRAPHPRLLQHVNTHPPHTLTHTPTPLPARIQLPSTRQYYTRFAFILVLFADRRSHDSWGGMSKPRLNGFVSVSDANCCE